MFALRLDSLYRESNIKFYKGCNHYNKEMKLLYKNLIFFTRGMSGAALLGQGFIIGSPYLIQQLLMVL